MRTWRPPGVVRAGVLLVHGLSEHCGRYGHLATHLAERGFMVVAYDHRHHGLSEGRPRALIREFDVLSEDLGLVQARARELVEGAPLFAYGHSLGAAVIARRVALHGPENLSGLVLSSAAFRFPDDFSPFLRRLAPALNAVAPRLPTVNRDRAYLSRDPSVARAWDADPHTYKAGLRVRTGWVILQTSKDILKHADRFTLPLLVLHGSEDRVTDPAGSRAFYEAAASSDKTLTIYDGHWHELINDLGKERVIHDIASWLDERSPRAAVD